MPFTAAAAAAERIEEATRVDLVAVVMMLQGLISLHHVRMNSRPMLMLMLHNKRIYSCTQRGCR